MELLRTRGSCMACPTHTRSMRAVIDANAAHGSLHSAATKLTRHNLTVVVDEAGALSEPSSNKAW